MRVTSTFLAWAFVCLSGAHAQEPESARALASARALFHQGVVCADAHDWSCAADRFGRARALHASPAILSNEAVALDHLGRVVEASEAYRAILRDSTASTELRATAQRGVAALAPRIGRLTLTVDGSLDGVVLWLDDEALDASVVGVAVPVDPGSHTVSARRAGDVVATQSVEAVAARDARVTLILPPPPPVHDVSIEADPHATRGPSGTGDEAGDALADSTPPSHHELYEEPWLWTIVGVLVVGAAVGITVGVVTSSSDQTPMGSLGTIDIRP